MHKKTDSLTFKLTIVFLLLTIVAVCTSGYVTYKQQHFRYLNERQQQIAEVSSFLRNLVEDDSDEYPFFQKYLIQHRTEIYLPLDFDTDCSDAEYYYHNLLEKKFPNQEFGEDFSYEDFDRETGEACTLYNYRYWSDLFWKAEETLDVPYTMILVPADDGTDAVYRVIDSKRKPHPDDASRMLMCDRIDMPRNIYPKLWESWENGLPSNGFDEVDTASGRTFGYYTPFYMNGKKIGLVSAEIFTDNINREILVNAIRQMFIIGLTIIFAMGFLLFIIDRICIRKLAQLEAHVQRYADEKDPSIADVIIADTVGKNEITSLSLQIASMIRNLHESMETLTQTVQKLKDAKAENIELGIQAERDILTGIRNRNAYEKEVQLLDYRIRKGEAEEFGIAMIDLNYLKRINDNYGHEKGNLAIQKLCRIACVNFAHSPAFRVGGDEFVIILKNSDYIYAEELVINFRDIIDRLSDDESLEPWERTSAAIGWTRFQPDSDPDVQSVFKRADALMYENKKAMHAARE